MPIETTGLNTDQIHLIEGIITAFKSKNNNTQAESILDESQDLLESAKLYAEIYQEDHELQFLTESALMD
jgi:hypothetical protein